MFHPQVGVKLFIHICQMSHFTRVDMEVITAEGERRLNCSKPSASLASPEEVEPFETRQEAPAQPYHHPVEFEPFPRLLRRLDLQKASLKSALSLQSPLIKSNLQSRKRPKP